MTQHDFGARPRDSGWIPLVHRDIYEWFNNALALTFELDGMIDGRSVLADNIRHLWHHSGCQDELEHASKVFSNNGLWLDGWLAFRTILRFDGPSMQVEIRDRLVSIIDRLKPSDLLGQAKAIVLMRRSGGFDIVDGEEKNSSDAWTKLANHATELGKVFATDETLLRTFLPDVFAEPSAMRAWPFGKGLAVGADDVAGLWAVLHEELTKIHETVRNITILGGFLSGAAERDPTLVASVLDALSDDSVLAHQLPWLQSQVAMDDSGIQRLLNTIDAGEIEVRDLFQLTRCVTRNAPTLPLINLLISIAAMPDGSMLALQIFHMHLHCLQDDNKDVEPILIDCGRSLLAKADFVEIDTTRDFGLQAVVEICLSGLSGEADAKALCYRIRNLLDKHHLLAHEIDYFLQGLLKVQPFITLERLSKPCTARRSDS